AAVEGDAADAAPLAAHAPLRLTGARRRFDKRAATFLLVGLLLGLVTPPDPWAGSVAEFATDHVMLTVLLVAVVVAAIASAAFAFGARRRGAARA
ncbi:MAG: hypothetical protein JWQ48_3425, partial [Conexibacter sp.]|nr:hypothetical protein [Conexibacter sp.]